MKRIIIFLALISLIFLNAFRLVKAENCNNIIELDNLNSKNVLNYLKENNLEYKINRICSDYLCANINPAYLKNNINNFINKNISYLKSKNEEESITSELKGFRITKIYLNAC